MAWRLRDSLVFALLVPLFLLVAAGAVRAGDLNTPVRIEIQPQVREAAVGGTIGYAVSLRNALGEAVAAPKRMTIDVQATLPSGQVETRQVTIEPGATDGSGAVPVSEPGAIPIGASNPELIGGGSVVFGKPDGGATRGLIRAMDSVPAITSGGTAAVAHALGVEATRAEGVLGTVTDGQRLSRVPAAAADAAAADAVTAASDTSSGLPAAVEEADAPGVVDPPSPSPAAARAVIPRPDRTLDVTDGAMMPASPPAAMVTGSATSGAEPAVEVLASLPPGSGDDPERTLMLYVPDTQILADGQNDTEVTAYLDPCPGMVQDVVVRLAVTKGHLDPNVVTIPRGECSASTRWRSDRMSLGDATLSVLVTVPRLKAGEKVVRSFVPPIHSLRLTPNPAEINLLNQGDVLAELHDDVNGVPVATDRPMKLTLALREGNGALRPLELTFDKGDSTTRASFQPTYWGKVVVAGQIPFRLEEHAEFVVRSGIGIFLFSAVGGLIGGVLAYRAKKEKPLRILIGLVTGFALFAFFLFFGVENILEVTGGLNVLNPVSVFLLSLAGGWAGTNVLAFALKRIGIEA